MSSTVTFDGAPAPGTIDFGVGQPSADLLPVDLLRAASAAFFAGAVAEEFNYGPVQGDVRCRASLASFLGREYGQPVDASSLLLSGGNSQAIDFLCTRFVRPGDTIFVEEPSYFLAFRIFADHGARVVAIPVDDEGLDIGVLEAELARTTPKFVYTIPSYQNPTGRTMSGERRLALVELAGQYGFLIVADEVYQSLWCFDPPPPALGTLIDSEQVLSLGSFSKILAPGLRLGWIQTGPVLMKKLLSSGVLNSGGTVNHVTSHIVAKAIDLGMLDTHVGHLRATYRRRIETMDRALRAELRELACWRRPDGGYFFWLALRDGLDARALRAGAAAFRTGFQPGPVCSSSGRLGGFIRLSFAHYDDADICAGVCRVAALLQDQSSR